MTEVTSIWDKSAHFLFRLLITVHSLYKRSYKWIIIHDDSLDISIELQIIKLITLLCSDWSLRINLCTTTQDILCNIHKNVINTSANDSGLQISGNWKRWRRRTWKRWYGTALQIGDERIMEGKVKAGFRQRINTAYRTNNGGGYINEESKREALMMWIQQLHICG